MDFGPGFDQIIKAVGTVGFPIVVTVLLLLSVVGPLFLVIRLLISSVSTQVSEAVALFSGTLANMSNRNQENSERLAESITRQGDAIVAVTAKLADNAARQNELLAQVNESVRIQLSFTTQQMAQQAVLTHQVSRVAENAGVDVAHADNVLGVISPVEEHEEATHEQGC